VFSQILLYFNGAGTASDPPAYFESELVAYLLANTNLTDLIGHRLFPLKVDEDDDLPAVCYSVVEALNQQDLDGPTGDVFADVQFAVGAYEESTTVKVAKAIDHLSLGGLDGFKGILSASIIVKTSHQTGNRGEYVSPIDDSDRGSYWKILSYRIRYIDPS
jgi:hypothetical protein